MRLNVKFFSIQIVTATVIISLLISCSKTSEYKRKKPVTTGETPPTQPTTPPPTTTNPTGYLALTKADARFIYEQSGVIIENLQFENIEGIALYIKKSNNIIVRNCFFNKATNCWQLYIEDHSEHSPLNQVLYETSDQSSEYTI